MQSALLTSTGDCRRSCSCEEYDTAGTINNETTRGSSVDNKLEQEEGAMLLLEIWWKIWSAAALIVGLYRIQMRFACRQACMGIVFASTEFK